METYAERLNWALEQAGMSQSELARAVGVRPQSIQYLCDRARMAQGSKYSSRIADILQVSARWLETGEGQREMQSETSLLEQRLREYKRLRFERLKELGASDRLSAPEDRQLDHLDRKIEDIQAEIENLQAPAEPAHFAHNTEQGPDVRGLVPLISWVQAGSWSSIVDNFHPGDAEDWMPCIKRVGPHAFALRVRGVSMEPKYQDGDIIFIDPDAQAEHGRNIVIRLENEQEATFKQLVVEGGHKFLKPLNPDWPGPKLIPINGDATICGVVVGKWVPE